MANVIQLGADTTGFVAGVGRAQRAMSGLGSSIRNATQGGAFEGIASGIKNLVGGIGIFAALKSAASQFYSALDAGGALVDLGAQTGVALDKLMVLQSAFKMAGLGAEAVQPTLSKLQRNIAEAANGSKEAATKFADMGINLDDIAYLSPDEQLQKVAEKIQQIENPAQRAAAAIDIFGKGGAKLLSVFSAGGLEEIQKNIGNQASLMLVNAGIFDKASDVLGTAGTKVQGFFVGVASEVMPQIMEVIDAVNSIDLSYIGQELGNAIAFWINYFDNFGAQGELIGNTLKLAFMNAVNSLNDALQTTWVQVTSNLKLAFGNAINFLATEMSVAFAKVVAAFKSMLPGGGNMEEETKKAAAEARSKATPIDTDKLSREADDARFFVPKPVFDTTETEAKIERDTGIIEATKQANIAKALEENPVKTDTDSGAGFLGKTKLSTGAAVGMPDISSLQKVGGGSALLAPGQDNSPAYQSVRIQEDIRDYIKTLIDVVKQGGQDYQVAPSAGSGLVLTA